MLIILMLIVSNSGNMGKIWKPVLFSQDLYSSLYTPLWRQLFRELASTDNHCIKALTPRSLFLLWLWVLWWCRRCLIPISSPTKILRKALSGAVAMMAQTVMCHQKILIFGNFFTKIRVYMQNTLKLQIDLLSNYTHYIIRLLYIDYYYISQANDN